jgi:hypothetical protein
MPAFHVPPSANRGIKGFSARGWEMDETFQARWRNAAVGLCLTVAVFAAGWLIAFS